eukprot:g4826.t1
MLLILCIQNIFAQDVQYHITQVGINTVLKNLRHAKIYEDALTEGLRYNVTETLYYHHNWHILEVRFDASSPQYRLTRTAKVLGLHVEFGNKTIDPNSIGTITMTGNLRVSQKVEAFVEWCVIFCWDDCHTYGQYDYRISVTSTPTVDWDSCYQSKFDHWLVNFLAGELNDKAMDLMNQVLRDQLSNIVIPGIINVTDNLYLSYKVKHLSIQPGSAFSAQANVSFHTRIPAQTFGLHRKNLIPQYWPVAPKVKSTMMGIGISKTTFTNFLDALSVAGMLDFSGKTILFGTHLFFNGSIDKPSVQFPKGAVHTSAIVHQKSLRVRLDCNNSFNIFRAELNNVTEHLVLGCKSWEDGLFVQLKNMTIASAVVAAESSTLPLPNSVLKPLAQRGLDSAVPYVDKILSKIKIHFPVETKWLTPTGPHPITRTIGEENGEDGYMQIMWICTCSEDTYYEHCGDDFCASSGSTKDDLTAFTKKKRTVQKTTTIGKLNEFLPVYPITLQDNITNRSAKNSSCYTLAYFSNNDCDMEKVGEVVNKVILCSPKTSTSVCLEPPNLLQSYFGEEISGSSFSTIPKFGIKCMSGCKTCLSMFSELNKCTSSFVLSHSDITGKFICDEDNTVVPDKNNIYLQMQRLSSFNGTNPRSYSLKARGTTIFNFGAAPKCIDCSFGPLKQYCKITNINNQDLTITADLFCQKDDCDPSSCESKNIEIYFGEYNPPKRVDSKTFGEISLQVYCCNCFLKSCVCAIVVPVVSLFLMLFRVTVVWKPTFHIISHINVVGTPLEETLDPAINKNAGNEQWWNIFCICSAVQIVFWITLELKVRKLQRNAYPDLIEEEHENERTNELKDYLFEIFTWINNKLSKQSESSDSNSNVNEDYVQLYDEATINNRTRYQENTGAISTIVGWSSHTFVCICTILTPVYLFVLELGYWLVEKGPYKTSHKIMARRLSALLAGLPYFITSSNKYESMCSPIYNSTNNLSDAQWFECSYETIKQRLTDITQTPFYLNRNSSDFDTLFKTHGQHLKTERDYGIFGAWLMLFIFILSAIEGIDIPLGRLYKYVSPIVGQSQFPGFLNESQRATFTRMWHVVLGWWPTVSRTILELSRVVGVLAMLVIFYAGFHSFTTSFGDLLQIDCKCDGDFCDLLKQSATASFQNVQFVRLGTQLLLLCLSLPWTLGRIAFFLKIEVTEEGPTEESKTISVVVWVTFICTTLFTTVTAVLMGIGATVVGISWVWVVGIYILGAALPLFAILYSPPAFAERHGNDYVDYEEKDCSKDSCLCLNKTVSIGWKYFASFLWFLMFLLPIVVFYVYFTKRKAEFRNRPKSDCMSVPSPPMYLAWGTGWFLFGVCYIISRGFADLESGEYKNFVTGMKEKDLEVLRDHFKSAYTVLKLAILNLFGPKDIGNTLAEFFGADVILGDIVFGLVNLARVDKTTFGLS